MSAQASGGITVFAGPCLAGLPPPPDLRLRPPAQRGDILHALGARPHTLLLLDGYYYDVPAVTHKELLYALDTGVRVIGAASMGALRAAELAACGMEGVGTIFRWYRDGHIEGDDEVALLHAPAEDDYRPLTIALVEVRQALDDLIHQSAVARADADALLACLSALPFSARESVVVRREAHRIWGETLGDTVARAIASADLKRRDALEALRVAHNASTSAPQHTNPPSTTIFLGYHRERAMGPTTPGSPSFQHASQLVQLFHPQAPDFVRQIRRRFLLASATVEVGLETDYKAEQQLTSQLEAQQEAVSGRPLLPVAEVQAEARLHHQAIAAVTHFGSVEAAYADLAARFGLVSEGATNAEEQLLALLEAQYDLLPAWHLIRAATFTTALVPALAVAETAREVHRCFRRWARGARIATPDLEALAANLWRCPPDAVATEAARRALFPSYGFAPGFREAVALIASAERLPEAINDYPARRQALRAMPLTYALP